jgi:hypothetical protein
VPLLQQQGDELGRTKSRAGQDWSPGPWKVLARSWLPRGYDFCGLPDWTARPDASQAFHSGWARNGDLRQL